MDNNQLATQDFSQLPVGTASPFELSEDERFIADLTAERKVQFCSMKPQNEEEEVILFNAMNNSDKRLGDCINEVINVRHVYVEVVTCVNRETGEGQYAPRIVLIDEKGVSYQCVSLGIFSCLKKLLSIKGNPADWKNPVSMKVLQITKGEKKLLTLSMVSPKVGNKK